MRKVAIAFALLSVTLLLWGCGNKSAQEELSVTWGRADAKEININSKISGRVVKLLVKEGEKVEQGQLLAYIDKRSLLAQKAQLEADIKAIQEQQIQAAATTAMQSGTTNAALNQAQSAESSALSDLNMAKADYVRYEELVSTGAVSVQAFEQQRNRCQVAEAAYAKAQATTSQAIAALMQNDVNAANEAVLVKRLEQAVAALDELMVSLDETEIKAPFAGIVTAKYVEEGSMISQGTPLFALQDPLDNWVNFKIPETELGHFHLHQTVELLGRDEKTRLSGEVVDISSKSEFATQRATSERGDSTDIISFNVKIQVDSENLHPGMRFRLLENSL